jgi:heme exporter protein A
LIGIRITDLAHEYDEREVFHSVNFACDAPCLAVTGHNGSGKSTLLRIIAGLLVPTSGKASVLINGSALDRESLRAMVGMAAPDIRLYSDLTTRENLRFLLKARCSSYGEERISQVLDDVGLASRADDLVRELSTGLRQRACFAAAIVHSPGILLLDEPSSNLDSDGLAMVRSVIDSRTRRGMVVLATNDSAEAEIASACLDLGEAH